MRISILAFITAIFLLSATFSLSCAKKKMNGEAATQETQNVPANTNKLGMPESRPIPPNTALVSAIMESIEDAESHYRCTLKIEAVHGYGAATRPIATGTTLEVLLPKSLVNDENSLQSKEPMQLSLSFQQVLQDKNVQAKAASDGQWLIVRMR